MDLKDLAGRIPGNPVGRVTDGAYFLKVLADAGVLSPVRPDRLGRMLATYLRWGNNPATASAIGAIRHPDDVYIEDEPPSLREDVAVVADAHPHQPSSSSRRSRRSKTAICSTPQPRRVSTARP